MKKKIIKIIVTIFLIAGMLIVLYPTFATLWNDYRQKKVVNSYKKIKDNIDYSLELNNAYEYNKSLFQINKASLISKNNSQKDTYYESLINIKDNGSMGYINIPRIAVVLPIYHYFTDDNNEGLGHIYGSSLPVGGINTHSLLAGHRGVPSAKLLTNLDLLEEGDLFYIHVFSEVLTYKVCNIKTIIPKDIDDIVIEEGKDLVTLITCTPYAVNSHRLLVTGERIETVKVEEKASAINKFNYLFDASQIFAIILFVIMTVTIIFINKKGGVRR